MRALTDLLVRVQREAKRLAKAAFLAGWLSTGTQAQDLDEKFESWWKDRE